MIQQQQQASSSSSNGSKTLFVRFPSLSMIGQYRRHVDETIGSSFRVSYRQRLSASAVKVNITVTYHVVVGNTFLLFFHSTLYKRWIICGVS